MASKEAEDSLLDYEPEEEGAGKAAAGAGAGDAKYVSPRFDSASA